ncbi:hypothetical protein CFREI_03310 [Corynebacterium freiburgense]|nr:hypothetical protein CFREI_03310 [Corynebacterium freiburgense]
MSSTALLLTPRKIGWGLTALSYILPGFFWWNTEGYEWTHAVYVAIILLSVVVNIIFAIKFKYYDLWAGALFSLTSLFTIFWWHAPFFSVS